MYLAVIMGKFAKQVGRDWFPSTTGPLLSIMSHEGGFEAAGCWLKWVCDSLNPPNIYITRP